MSKHNTIHIINEINIFYISMYLVLTANEEIDKYEEFKKILQTGTRIPKKILSAQHAPLIPYKNPMVFSICISCSISRGS
jgi:hypothetical protein